MIPVVPISRSALDRLPQRGLFRLLKAKRGAEIPGHKYLRRQPKPDGTWRYFYTHPVHGKLYAPDEVTVVPAHRRFFGNGRAARIWGMDHARGAFPNDHSKMMIVVGRESIKKAAHVSSA